MSSPIFIGITAIVLTTSSISHELRVDNIRIYEPGQKAFSTPKSLYIDNGKILKVAESTEPAYQADKTFDANGKFAIPGLIDLHVHMGSSGSSFTEFQYLPPEAHLSSNLFLGITSVVDLFSPDITINEVAQLSRNQVTPDFFYAGTLFTNPGGHGTQMGVEAFVIHTDEDIEGLWQKHLAKKPTVTKAVIESFGGHGETLTDSQLRKLGELSKQHGLPYFVHVTTLTDAKRAIKAGATALAHGINSEPVDQELINLLKEYDVTYIPTIAVMLNHHNEIENRFISAQPKLLKAAHKTLLNCVLEKDIPTSKWQDITWLKRSTGFSNLAAIAKSGVSIGAGSDAGNPFAFHGIGMHHELQMLSQAGLSNAEVINAATTNAANAIKKSSNLGKLDVGYRANFVLLNNNPLANLGALQDIQAVFKDGTEINRESTLSRIKQLTPMGPDCFAEKLKSQQANRLIDDFTGKQQWKTITDTVMGGNSTAELAYADGAINVKTKIGKTGAFGAWTGIEMSYSTPVNASEFEGITITYKGSSIPFGLSVYHQDVKDYDHFRAQLPQSKDWSTYKVSFSDLKQWGYGRSINWSAEAITGLSLSWGLLPGQHTANTSNTIEIREISYF